jgi:hypothetical protein
MNHVSPVKTPRIRRQLPGVSEENMDDPSTGSSDDEYLGIADALRLLLDATVDSAAPAEVEALVWERISRYGTPKMFLIRFEHSSIGILKQPTNTPTAVKLTSRATSPSHFLLSPPLYSALSRRFIPGMQSNFVYVSVSAVLVAGYKYPSVTRQCTTCQDFLPRHPSLRPFV